MRSPRHPSSGPGRANPAASRRAPGRERGIGLVELLVGIVIALFIVAAGATLLTNHLRENRELLIEARLMQDLRSTADLIARDLRRAGHWGAAGDGVWTTGAASALPNPYRATAPDRAASDALSFRYSRDASENNAVDANEQFGYRLRAGVIELQLGTGNWQALTDATALLVSEFVVTPTLQEIDLQPFCSTPCPAADANCPPHQHVRGWSIAITGQRIGDAGVRRSVHSRSRMRSDVVSGGCAE